MSQEPIEIVKANGEREPFVREKLETSLYNAGGDPETVEKIADTVEADLEPGETTRDIYHQAHQMLKEEKEGAACRYSLRDALMEFGPTGYPLEQFIGRLFEEWGSSVEVGLTVPGRCAEHEVDVLARKNTEVKLVEVKFHNEHGTPSDTQDALSARARFDDLLAGGSRGPAGDLEAAETWLVTNTKFTDHAVQYGECAGLRMVGWNYPRAGNLQQMIEQARLHPLTCLSSLAKNTQQRLLKDNIVLCRTIRQDTSILSNYGLGEKDVARTHQEIDSLEQYSAEANKNKEIEK